MAKWLDVLCCPGHERKTAQHQEGGACIHTADPCRRGQGKCGWGHREKMGAVSVCEGWGHRGLVSGPGQGVPAQCIRVEGDGQRLTASALLPPTLKHRNLEKYAIASPRSAVPPTATPCSQVRKVDFFIGPSQRLAMLMCM